MSAWEGSIAQAQSDMARWQQQATAEARRLQQGPQTADDHIAMLRKRAELLRSQLKNADAWRQELSTIETMLAPVSGQKPDGE